MLAVKGIGTLIEGSGFEVWLLGVQGFRIRCIEIPRSRSRGKRTASRPAFPGFRVRVWGLGFGV